MTKSQTKRIASLFTDNPNKELSSVELHRFGSGKPLGWCGSFSRRISDCRKLGMNIVKCREEKVDGQRHTWYKYIPKTAAEIAVGF